MNRPPHLPSESYYFVCYAHSNSATVLDDVRWLEGAGQVLWYDNGIRVGDSWRAAIADALSHARGLIFMSSRESVASVHCNKEISFALDHDIPVYVVRLDSTELPPELALYLNDRQYLERHEPIAEYRARLLAALEGPPRPVAATASATRQQLVVAAAVATVVIAIAASAFVALNEAGPTTEPDRQVGSHDFPRIGMPPVEQLTEDENVAYLARAVEDDLRHRMQYSVFEAVSLPASARSMTIVELGRAYDVDYVWFRSIARHGDSFRVARRLAETRTGETVRTFQHDITGKTPFEVQDRFAQYTEQLMWAVDQGEEERVRSIPLDKMTAWDLVSTSHGDVPENRRRALAIAPDLFAANSLVASDLFWSVVRNQSDDPARDRTESLRLARRAYELAPFDQSTATVAARVEIAFGSPQLALMYIERVGELKSLSSRAFYDALLANGLYERALEHAAGNPIIDSLTLANVYLANGRYLDAASLYRDQLKASPQEFILWMNLANALGHAGRIGEGETILAGLREAGRTHPVRDFAFGSRLYWGNAEFGELTTRGLHALGEAVN